MARKGQCAPCRAKRRKHATANGDGTYTLSMDVKGGSTEQEQQQVIPLEVVLVLDVSGSMDGVITRDRSPLCAAHPEEP